MATRCWTTCALMCAVLCTATRGDEDKNGVSPNTISRPSGPGSLEGLGDAFQPALNTGMAKYAVSLALPEGIAGFTPSLRLSYDGGKGFGMAGLGWSFGPGCIRLQTEKGIPRYGEAPDGESIADRFLGMEGEELVPLQGGYYLAKVESLFIRYRFVGPHWEAHTKGGIRLEFGLTPNARLTNAAGSKTYAWCLQRKIDTHGNVIEYTYIQPNVDDRQIYLSEIRYGPGSDPWTHSYSVRMTYENRPDPFTDYRSGFKIRTSKRLKQVDVRYDSDLIRRYVLGYGAHVHWSFLTTITHYGADGTSTLPVTTLDYSIFAAGLPGTPISAGESILASSSGPPESLDSPHVELIDLNGDGLPDLLSTDTNHVAYLNRGVQDPGDGSQAIKWEGPILIAAEEPRTHNFTLSADNVHLADMTGDGLADLVVTDPDDSSVEYFENTGQIGWAAGRLMAIDNRPPPSPFGAERETVITSDLGFNKRIDVIQSEYGTYFSWFNQGDGRYTGPIATDAAFDGSRPVEFSDPGVSLADMNGDRLNDVVKITPYSVIYWANQGYARFGERVEMTLPDRSLDESPGGNLHRAKLVDVNGDGLSDLVVERARGDDLWFWLNLGNGTWDTSRVIIDLPITGDAVARWADINGNGSTDLIYADSSRPQSRINAVDLAELIGGSSHYNLLTGIDNGYGRQTVVSYRPTTAYSVEAFNAGHAWTTRVPFPVQVVSRTETSIGLDLDGYPDEGPDGDIYVTDFVYRDGYYEPIEQQFRGFAFVKKIARGNERFGGTAAPTLVTRYRFHTGAPDGIDNDGDGETDEEGDLWKGREEEPLKGVQLWQETTSLPDDGARDGDFADDSLVFARIVGTWEIRNLCGSDGGALVDLFGDGYLTNDAYGRQVRLAVQTQTNQSIIERESGTISEVETRFDVDALGNAILEHNAGDTSDSNDDLHTGYEYAQNESAWIVNRLSRTFQTDQHGSFVSETRNYYDGEPFLGLGLGGIGDRGVLHRTESLLDEGGDAVNVMRRQLDAYGNPIVLRDANDNDRQLEYDSDLLKFTIREIIVVGGGSADLEVSATYDFHFGSVLTFTGMNGHTVRFEHDVFGRPTAELLPTDEAGSPTKTYAYDLGAPISSITTTLADNMDTNPDVISRVFFDGLGRKLGMYDAGGPAMTEVTLYNSRGQPRKVFQPYFGGDGTWSPPAETDSSTSFAYDATGRVMETISPPDNSGVTARSTIAYSPFTVEQSDGEDNHSGGPHEGTPKTLVYDGLNRLVEVHEIVGGTTEVTRYRYALPDRLIEIEDANNNVKIMRYDGLGRRTFMNDLNRGHTSYAYDSVGNLISSVDAKGQVTTYSYDGVNRMLTVDYLDTRIAYHYDVSHPDYPALGNVLGRLGWVEDLSGTEIRGYDMNGHLETVVKRIDQSDGSYKDHMTQSLADNLGRVYQGTYPDGDVVRYTYDARGFLSSVPGFVNGITYDAAGQKSSRTLGNGVTTTYTYDPRLRLSHLIAQANGTVFQELTYEFDQVSNLLSLTDDHAPDGSRSQSATFEMDNLYRLTRAEGEGYGMIEYDYDRLGNMISKTSPNIVDDDVHLGSMSSGGSGGTSGRTGREPGDPPGPHALTMTDNGKQQRLFEYDDNGNMTSHDGDVYEYDFADRLVRVIKDGRDVRYLYDYSGRRIIKRVDGVQTSYISGDSEVRAGKMIKYVRAGSGRLARVEGSIPPSGSVIQTIDLALGWNLISFQVDPGSTDPAAVLDSIEGLYSAVFGHDGSGYTRYILGDPDNTLTELLPNAGYWVKMVAQGRLVLEGPVSQAVVDVSADTPTLVAFPGLTSSSLADLLTQYPDITGLWSYQGGPEDWKTFGADGPSYANTLDATASGRGYWLVSSAPITLSSPPEGDVRFYHGDHLGSTNVVTDADGNLVSEFFNYPFGTLRHAHHAQDPFNPDYQFTGKEHDDESGLHYFEARYYGSPFARFTRVDPLLAAEFQLETPQLLNLYAYAMNRPSVHVDPSGLKPIRKRFEVSDTFFSIYGAVADTVQTALTVKIESAKKAVVEATKQGLDKVIKIKSGNLKSLLKTNKSVGKAGGPVSAATLTYSALQFAIAIDDYGTNKTKDASDLVGTGADLVVGLIGTYGGKKGTAFATAFGLTTLAAPTIDRYTGLFDSAVISGNKTGRAVESLTGSANLGSLAGSIRAANESSFGALDPTGLVSLGSYAVEFFGDK